MDHTPESGRDTSDYITVLGIYLSVIIITVISTMYMIPN